MKQSIRYLKTADDLRLAWATAGSGPALVKASNWLTHLEYDWDSPVWRHWIRFLACNYHTIRYDERGCGMTEWDVGDVSFPRWVEDLECVIDAAAPAQPFVLLGVSQGGATAISYAVRYPERVSHLILYGAYAVGWANREDEDGRRRYRAIVELARLGWGKDNPVFRQLFTSHFAPEASPEQLGWFNELCARTSTPEVASRLLAARAEIDVQELLGQVSVPTLVVHARNDQVVPLVMGQMLASEIPNAEFVMLDSRNHILLEDEPAWERFKACVLEFTGSRASEERGVEHAVFRSLTTREREILGELIEGKTNAEIGAALFISEKTVRNHVSRIFEKLAVTSRAQAIVLAKDKGFVATPTKEKE